MKNVMLSVGLLLHYLRLPRLAPGRNILAAVTGKTMDQCCCEMKDGKFYCPKRLTTSAVAMRRNATRR
jgi:hypothetical protein